MPSTATVSGKVGPGLTLTSHVFTNVTSFTLETEKEVLAIVTNGNTVHIDVSAAATWTLTVSGANYTLTVAN